MPVKTHGDFSQLAVKYSKFRPGYSESVLSALLCLTNHPPPTIDFVDVGAGTGIWTRMVADRGCRSITAVEPNDEMRRLGMKRTKKYADVSWYEAVAENTEQPSHTFDIVTFGSSFTVTDRPLALRETDRLLKPKGWFACMVNHRDLSDPIQNTIESIIKSHITNYKYGTRREDQTDIINKSGFFTKVKKIEGQILHQQSREDCLTAWRSHATLRDQAGDQFTDIIRDIETYLEDFKMIDTLLPHVFGWHRNVCSL